MIRILLLSVLTLTGVYGTASGPKGPKWLTDLDTAKQVAQKENKAILVNFSGSDWCGWCKRLDREVFKKKAFGQFAADELVLLQVDFPRYKRQSQALRQANDALARQFQVRAFPTILLLDANEKVLFQTGYKPGGVQAYIDHLKPFIP